MEEGEMGGMIPLGDASRRPTRAPVVTILIIVVNSFVFVRELMGGEAFVDPVVGDSRPNCFWPSLDHDSGGDVHARQLVAHHRQYDLLMGVCPEIEAHIVKLPARAASKAVRAMDFLTSTKSARSRGQWARQLASNHARKIQQFGIHSQPKQPLRLNLGPLVTQAL
jgi:hypothetical protein